MPLSCSPTGHRQLEASLPREQQHLQLQLQGHSIPQRISNANALRYQQQQQRNGGGGNHHPFNARNTKTMGTGNTNFGNGRRCATLSNSGRAAAARGSNNNTLSSGGSSRSGGSSSCNNTDLRVLMPNPDDILPKEAWTDFSGKEDWSSDLLVGEGGAGTGGGGLESPGEDLENNNNNNGNGDEGGNEEEVGLFGSGDGQEEFYYCRERRSRRKRIQHGEEEQDGDRDEEESELLISPSPPPSGAAASNDSSRKRRMNNPWGDQEEEGNLEVEEQRQNLNLVEPREENGNPVARPIPPPRTLGPYHRSNGVNSSSDSSSSVHR